MPSPAQPPAASASASPLRVAAMFSDQLGTNLGLMLDVLLAGHLLALGYWGFSMFREMSRGRNKSKAQ